MKPTKKELTKIKNMLKLDYPDIDISKLTYRKDIDDIYYFISNELGIKIVFKSEFFKTFNIYSEPDAIPALLNDINDNPYIVYNDYDKFIKTYLQKDSMKNIIDTFDNFFNTHYNNLKGFPKLLCSNSNFYIFEYVYGQNTHDTILLNDNLLIKQHNINLFNYNYLKNNNIPINYEYSLADSILNDSNLYFVDIENFEINMINYWFIIHTSNSDDIIDLRLLNKATTINSFMMLEAN